MDQEKMTYHVLLTFDRAVVYHKICYSIKEVAQTAHFLMNDKGAEAEVTITNDSEMVDAVLGAQAEPKNPLVV